MYILLNAMYTVMLDLCVRKKDDGPGWLHEFIHTDNIVFSLFSFFVTKQIWNGMEIDTYFTVYVWLCLSGVEYSHVMSDSGGLARVWQIIVADSPSSNDISSIPLKNFRDVIFTGSMYCTNSKVNAHLFKI